MFSCNGALHSLVIPLPSLRKVMATIKDAGDALPRPLLHCAGRCTSSPDAGLALAQCIPVTFPDTCPWLTGPTATEIPGSLHARALQAGQRQTDTGLPPYLKAGRTVIQFILWSSFWDQAEAGPQLRPHPCWDFPCPMLLWSRFLG